ncbi:hypothetical protein Q7P36_001157 [Cladosporium allicinum]
MYQITNIYALAAFGTIGGALFGFDVSSMSAWIDREQYLEYFNHPNSNMQGGITASMSAGSFIGALCAGFIADKWGRRYALMGAAIVWIIGAAIQCSAQNVGHLIAGRIVSGLSVGVTSSQVCVYLAELAPGRIRGRIVGLQQWSIEWGILIMFLVAYGCTSVAGPAAFRIAWGVQAIPGFVLFGALVFFPESPRWLAGQERWEECLGVLAAIHAKGNRDDPLVQAEYMEVQEAVRIMQEAKGVGFLELFGPKVWKRTMCGTSVQMWQQLVGGNVMMYYVVYVFSMAGLTGNTNLYSSAIQYVIFLVTTGCVLPFIDRIGRRTLLLIGAVSSMILHYSIAAIMATQGRHVDQVDGNENLKWEVSGASGKAVIALSYIFVGVYGATWAPVGWIYCSEVFPLKYRAKGVGLSAATNWIFNFALAYFVAPAFTNIQWKTYIIFGVLCTAMTFHIFFTYPETAGRTLEEIDYIFECDLPVWRTSQAKSKFAEDVEAVQRTQSLDGKSSEEVVAKHDKAEQLERA